MTFLAIWRGKHPGQPDPNEATLTHFRTPTLVAWREEHPGQPDPSEATLYKWLCNTERRGFEEDWREAFPNQPIPDNYKELRRWAIREHNLRKAALVLGAMDTSFH